MANDINQYQLPSSAENPRRTALQDEHGHHAPKDFAPFTIQMVSSFDFKLYVCALSGPMLFKYSILSLFKSIYFDRTFMAHVS